MERNFDELEDFDNLEEVEDEEQEEEIEETEETEESEETESSSEKDEEKNPENQVEKDEQEKANKKEQNRLNAERRKKEKAKREAELEEKGYNKALKESIDGVNPYTNKPIVDDVDMQIYKDMRELEKQGKDPINDYADYVAEKSRKQLKEEQLKKQQEDYATKDIDDFSKSHPDIDVSKLLNDEHFSSFADGKLGVQPLTKIYENFIKFESFYEKKAENDSNEKAIKKFSRTQSSIGPMKSPGEPKKKSFKEMSDEEFALELERIKGQVY